MTGKILLIYYHNIGAMRATQRDLIYSFKRHSGHLCYYVNAACGLPDYLDSVQFDAVIYLDAFLSKRWLPKRFRNLMKLCEPLKTLSGKKIAMPQDEFIYTDMLTQFVADYDIDWFFTTLKKSEWAKVYPELRSAGSKVQFERILTGYLEPQTIDAISKLPKAKERPIDIGYRARRADYALGRAGMLKLTLAEKVERRAAAFGLKTDISTEEKDTFFGMDWYRFLLKCKYTIGVEGGASISDRDGQIRRKIENYLVKHPKASFEEVEEACFKGIDGEVDLLMVSPRIFEACATRTCQLLIEGEYNGLVAPGRHYLEIKKDFSNLDDVLEKVRTDSYRNDITERAYKEIVEAGAATYGNFVRQVLDSAMGPDYDWSQVSEKEFEIYERCERRERLSWIYIPIRASLAKAALRLMPDFVFHRLVRAYD